MKDHRGKYENEIFVGNTCVRHGLRIPEHLCDLSTARLGEQAFDIYGKKIPRNQMRPLFIGRTEADAYDRIMMRRTFGNRY